MEVTQFGYRQELRRELRLRDLLAYGLIFMVLVVLTVSGRRPTLPGRSAATVESTVESTVDAPPAS